jgi:hypothetical protein
MVTVWDRPIQHRLCAVRCRRFGRTHSICGCIARGRIYKQVRAPVVEFDFVRDRLRPRRQPQTWRPAIPRSPRMAGRRLGPGPYAGGSGSSRLGGLFSHFLSRRSWSTTTPTANSTSSVTTTAVPTPLSSPLLNIPGWRRSCHSHDGFRLTAPEVSALQGSVPSRNANQTEETHGHRRQGQQQDRQPRRQG